METIPIAFRSLFKPIFWFVIIIIPFLINIILLPKYTFYLLTIILIFYIPCTLYLIIKLRKPKILISKRNETFIIHKRSGDIIIPLDSIKSISSNTNKINNDIILRTKFKSYRISDIGRVDNVESIMEEILSDFKYSNNKR